MKSTTVKLTLVIALLVLGMGKTFAQLPTNVTYVPQIALNGDPVEITYNAKETVLQGKKNVSAVVYEFKHYKWVATDLPLKPASADLWKTTFKPDSSTGIIALKFKADTLVDNAKDQGYFMQFRDKKRPGVMAPGGYAGWGLARSPKLGMDIPGYMNFKGISDTASYYWLNQEIAYHPSAKSKLVYVYAEALQGFMKEEALHKMELALNYLKRKDASESNLLNARKIYTNLLGNKLSADSLTARILAQYPKGNLARLNSYREIGVKDRAPEGILTASLYFVNNFPIAQTDAEFDTEYRISYGVVYQNIIILNAYLKKDTTSLQKYIGVIPYTTLFNLYYKVVQIPFDRKDQTAAELCPAAKLIVTRLESFRYARTDEFLYLSPSEWLEQFNTSFVRSVLPTHINLLYQVKQDAEALKYAAFAEQYLAYKNATVNGVYAQLLKQAGRQKELKQLLVKSMHENASTTEMLDMLKVMYLKEHHSENGFDAYVGSLKNSADQKAISDELMKGVMNKDMPQWKMYDSNGKLISSAGLIGKTVVLDFWATWCVPCKASFPGMKLAVEKYKNDPNVVFCFVDTEESIADYQTQVKAYVKQNNYPFQILFDNKAKDAKATGEVFDSMCKAFQISGIPQKLIIDPKGKLRFISIGYKGSATALADEISAMVDYVKSGK